MALAMGKRVSNYPKPRQGRHILRAENRVNRAAAPSGNAVKSFPIEYPAVLALATDFVTSVASAKTAGTPNNMCLTLFTALPVRG